MNRRTLLEIAVFTLLVAFGVAARALLHERYPNFAPVAAIALFAGYYFRSAVAGMAAPVLVMAISNRLIEQGGYSHWLIMASVYGCLVLPVALRGWLRQNLAVNGGTARHAVAKVGGLVACALGSSLLFFVATNFAVWLVSDMYAHTPADFLRCYVQALPFFRFTLAGDLVFAVLLFGGQALASRATLWQSAPRSVAAAA